MELMSIPEMKKENNLVETQEEEDEFLKQIMQ